MKLETHGLAFGYPERRVGHDVTIAIAPGEVLCLLGPNGCGKTTLFKTMLGLLAPQAGRISIGGDDLAHLPRAEVARRVSYVPQGTQTPFPYTALDMVLMGRVAHRGLFASPTREDHALAETALGRLGIASLADRDVTQLSGGQRQLVMIARALAQAAPLIVMDEPTASLDFGNQAVVLAQASRIAAEGAGIVLSTHDPNHAFAVATRVCLMRDGEVLALGSPDEALTSDRLSAVYGTAVDVETTPSGRRVCAPRTLIRART